MEKPVPNAQKCWGGGTPPTLLGYDGRSRQSCTMQLIEQRLLVGGEEWAKVAELHDKEQYPEYIFEVVPDQNSDR